MSAPGAEPIDIDVTPPAPPRHSRIPGVATANRAGRGLRNFVDNHRLAIVILLFIGAFVGVLFWKRILVRIGPGEAGVVYRLFQGGTVTDTTYAEGLRLVCPWNKMYVYNLRVQQVTDSFAVLSQDGLTMQVQVSIRFRPQPDQLGLLHKEVGPDYIEKVVKPSVQSVMRFVMGQYRPEQIYTSQGFIMQTAVKQATTELASRYIVLDDLLLTAIKLPPTVAASIESKLRAQQLSQEFDYRVQTEVKEANRKRTEAAGIRDFEKIVSGPGLTEQYLRYKGILATEELAKSPNPKIVIIGGGQDRMPIILDGGSGPPAGALAPGAPLPAVSGPPTKK